jgi:hypothetical protein
LLALCVILGIFCYATWVSFEGLYGIPFQRKLYLADFHSSLRINSLLDALKRPAALILNLSKFQDILLAIFDGNFGLASYCTPVVVVEKAVAQHEERRAASTHEAAPPPAVVLYGQLEVGEGHSDEGSHHDQNQEHNEQDGVDCVHLVAPDAGKDVVQLDVDGTEGQEASHQHLRWGGAVPRQGRDLSRKLGGPATHHKHNADEHSASNLKS